MPSSSVLTDLAEVRDRLLAARRILILTHLRPDGDALGSSFGMREYLRNSGRRAEVLLPEPPPVRFRSLCTGAIAAVSPEELQNNYDLVLLLDCAAVERIGCGNALNLALLQKRSLLNVDHHQSNRIPGTWNYLMPACSSASEIAARIGLAGAEPVTPANATFWLCGMMTDTGSFRFSNTTGDTLRIAAELLDRKADLERLVNALFFSKPLRQLEFETDLVQREMRLACGGRFAYAYISDELLAKHHFELREDEGLIDILREIDQVVIAMLVHRKSDGFKISLRSKDSRYPVIEIARRYGGGGHALAAGATLDLPDFAAVEKAMLDDVAQLLAATR